MTSINLLTLENLLDINEGLKEDALKDTRIEYSGDRIYPVQTYKLSALINSVPVYRSVFEIATYYLKNIILLQAFPDGNHRTALYAVEMFLKINGYSFNYVQEEAYNFQKKLYARRMMEYRSYEEMPISVLKENDNSVFSLCLELVRAHTR